MKPEPWKKAEELFHAVLEREPGERDAFLEKACAGDEVLRDEVKSLLDADQQAERFIEEPAAEGATQASSASGSSSVATPARNSPNTSLRNASGSFCSMRAR